MNTTELAKIIRENEELKVKVSKLKRRVDSLEVDRALEKTDKARAEDVQKAKNRVGMMVGLVGALLPRYSLINWYQRSEEEWAFRIPSDGEYLILLKRDGVEMIGFLDSNGEFDCLWPVRKKLPWGDVVMCQVATGEI